MITFRMMRAAWISDEACRVWYDALTTAADEFEINTLAREAPFLANAAHESRGLTVLLENLNYGAARLLELFPFTPQRPWGFTAESVNSYARMPERIANRIYANRLGNGPEASGDGWRYRGRGIFQLTGRANYEEFGTAFGRDLVARPDEALGTVLSCRIAGRFWQTRGCNELADRQDDRAIRIKINGGTIGLGEVKELIDNIEAAT